MSRLRLSAPKTGDITTPALLGLAWPAEAGSCPVAQAAIWLTPPEGGAQTPGVLPAFEIWRGRQGWRRQTGGRQQDRGCWTAALLCFGPDPSTNQSGITPKARASLTSGVAPLFRPFSMLAIVVCPHFARSASSCCDRPASVRASTMRSCSVLIFLV